MILLSTYSGKHCIRVTIYHPVLHHESISEQIMLGITVIKVSVTKVRIKV